MRCCAAVAAISALLVPATLWAQASAPQTATDFPYREAARVSGVVFGLDGHPVAGAVVTIGGAEAVTNDDGGFRARLIPGTYQVTVRLPGGAERWVARVEFEPGASTELVITSLGEWLPSWVDAEGGRLESAGEEGAPREGIAPVGPPGVLAGRVVDVDGGRPIEGARVFVRGVEGEGLSGEDGSFRLDVPAGVPLDVAIVHPAYAAAKRDDVVAREDGSGELLVELISASSMGEEFVVYIPRIEGATSSLLEERKQAATLNEVIGAEQFSSSGDSSAASALKRVTGLTVVGGRYVYVRGLGDRYSSTLLNGSTLPSPEPERRVVPLDLFPTALLESVTIQKTYSPDQPGEFGGGVVALKTRTFPAEFQASASVGVGYLTGTTLGEGTSFEGGAWDWLGVDDGTRALPERVERAGAQGPIRLGNSLTGGLEPAELEALGEAMPKTWGLEQRLVIPDWGGSAAIGDSWDWLGARWGGRASVTLSSGAERVPETFSFLRYDSSLDRLSVRDAFDSDELNRNVTLGAILALGWKLGEEHAITLTSMLNRVSDDTSIVYTGFNRDAGTEIRVRRGRWVERQLLFNQIAGEHTFGALAGLGVRWRYVRSTAVRDEPDRRETRYDFDAALNDFIYSNAAEDNSRLYSGLDDVNHDAAFDLSLPFSVWDDLTLVAKSGAQLVRKERDVETRRYKFRQLNLSDEQRLLAPEDLFTDELIGTSFRLTEITRETDNYGASQWIVAGYAMADVPITDAIVLSGGARLERSIQQVDTFELFAVEQEPIGAELDDTDVLGALNATWTWSERQQVRGALGRTVTRPDFRELTPACFDDVIGGNAVCGNPELDRGTIVHADARWEFYPQPGESVSAGAFYKGFNRPIEEVIVPGATDTLTFANTSAATLLGLEFEGRYGLAPLAEALSDLWVAGNLALIRSRVELDELEGFESVSLTSEERSLQGQSPYVVNAQLGWDSPETGVSLTALYNVFGPRIVGVGVNGIPDTVERPFHQLDLAGTLRLSEHTRLGLKARNLIDLPVRATIGDLEVRRARRGRSVSVSLGVSY